MKNVTSTYEFVKVSFNNINILHKIPLTDMAYIRIYLSVLKKLDKIYEKLNHTAKSKAKKNNLIELPIAIKILSEYKDYLRLGDRGSRNMVIHKIKEETSRQYNEYQKIKKEGNNYQMTLTQADALRIMNDYMDSQEIDTDIIVLYPENKDKLKEQNQEQLIPEIEKKKSMVINNKDVVSHKS